MKNSKRKIRAFIIILIIITTITAILNGVQPILTQHIIDTLIEKFDGLSLLFILLIGSIFVIIITELVSKITYSRFNRYITSFFRERTIHNILKQHTSIYSKNMPEEYFSMINNELPDILENTYIILPNIIFQLLSVLIYSLIVLFINIPLGLVVIVSNILSLLIPKLFRRKLEKKKTNYFYSLRRFNIVLNDLLEGFQEIRRSSFKINIESNTNTESQKSLDLKYNYEILRSLSEILIGLVLFSSSCLLLLLGSHFILKGNLSIGGLIAVIQISDLISAPLIGFTIDLGVYLSTLKLKNEYLNRFQIFSDYLEKTPVFLTDKIQSIEFNDVSLSYDGSRKILNDFTYKFIKGLNYQIAGDNGSGKSSLIKLLAREVEPCSGRILINSNDVSTLDDEELFKEICYVSQNPFLFKSTIKENIVMNREFNKARFEEILGIVNLDKANVDERIAEINNTNNCLSSGEKQKICIARALYSERNWVIFDEAMSNIDMKSTQIIEKYLIDNSDITFIHITHYNSNFHYDHYLKNEWS